VFDSKSLIYSESMHELRDVVNRKEDVRSGYGGILKSTNDVAIVTLVIK
jgi:hypothetical protein